jgi:hypothetical protein
MFELISRSGALPGLAAGPVAETFVRVGAENAEAVLSQLEQLIDESGQLLAQPSLLRARALLLARQHVFREAAEALHESATQARSQHAVVELAQTLAVLATVARQPGDEVTIRQADAQRSAVVERIGAEARMMAWAHGLPNPSRQ